MRKIFTLIASTFNLDSSAGRVLYILKKLPFRLKENFLKQRYLLKSAALSYTTVLCLVPLLALSFTFANIALERLGPDQSNQLIDNFIANAVPQIKLLENDQNSELTPELNEELESLPQKEDIRERTKEVVESVGSGQMGLIGTGFLFFLAGSLVLMMEHIFDDIWDAGSHRSIFTRALLYLVIIVIGLIFLSLAVTLSGRWQRTLLARSLKQIPYLTPLFSSLTPFVLFWFILTFIYMILPNKRVSLWAAIAGGVAAGSLIQVNSLLSSLYIGNLIMLGKIYGSLGILPILLIGLYTSWLIVLLGAELAHTLESLAGETR